jgi:hypothetical protein
MTASTSISQEYVFLDKKILKKSNRNVQLINDECVERDNVVGKLGKLIPNHTNVVGKLALNENRIRLRQGKKLIHNVTDCHIIKKQINHIGQI